VFCTKYFDGVLAFNMVENSHQCTNKRITDIPAEEGPLILKASNQLNYASKLYWGKLLTSVT
jgi:hypothetical protein